MNEEIMIPFDSDITLKGLRTVLAKRRLSVVRSFDLRLALAVHHHCPCPHHGVAGCDCHYVVLLVYGAAANPVVVTAHSPSGSRGETQIALVQDAGMPAQPQLAQQVADALLEAAQMLQLAPVVA